MKIWLDTYILPGKFPCFVRPSPRSDGVEFRIERYAVREQARQAAVGIGALAGLFWFWLGFLANAHGYSIILRSPKLLIVLVGAVLCTVFVGWSLEVSTRFDRVRVTREFAIHRVRRWTRIRERRIALDRLSIVSSPGVGHCAGKQVPIHVVSICLDSEPLVLIGATNDAEKAHEYARGAAEQAMLLHEESDVPVHTGGDKAMRGTT